ncbi:MAG: LptF/LptG family permease [Allosphingosinicella sp.]
MRGVAGPFLAITVAVATLMMLERALRLIHEMAARGADIAYFLPMLGALAPYYLDLALPAAFMVALILLVGRLDERLELEAMLASGLSMSRIAAPLVAFGVVVGLAGLATGGWLEPVGRYNFRAQRIEAINSARIGRLQPRAFYQPAGQLAVTFDRRDADGTIGGIFVWQRLTDGSELVITGRSGRIGFAPGRREFGIDLRDGRYVALAPWRPAQLVTFETMAFREALRLEDASWQRGWDQKEMTLSELRRARPGGPGEVTTREIAAEYDSRIARAGIIPLLPLLVLPLAFATKKGRRGLGVLLCGAILAAIHHSLGLAKALAISGAAAPPVVIFGAAALCAGLVLLVFLSGRRLPSHSPITNALKPIGEAFGRLAPRERAPPSLRGRTLSTYLAWQLGRWSLLSLVATVLLLQMVDLFDRSEAFVSRGFGPADIATFLWLRLPPTVHQALPVAALAGAMVTFAGLGRSHEMTAIRAAGVSQWRILLMSLPVPLMLALASFALAERAVPQSQLRFAAWWAATEPPRGAPPPASRWFRIGDDIVQAGAASADGTRLEQVRLFRRDAAGRLAERIAAARATAGAGGWTLSDVAVDRFDGGRAVHGETARMRWRTSLRPVDVAAFFSPAAALSAETAQRALEVEAPVSRNDSLFATRLHRRAAEPLAPLVLLLLALPLAFLSPRTGIAWPAMLYAGGGGLLYLVGDGVLTVAGQVGYWPAAVGAWTAPLVGALTVLLYAER